MNSDEAKQRDESDPLRSFRDRFLLPESDGRTDVYFVGNSLGLQPKRTRELVDEELDRWQRLGVRGHFEGQPGWIDYLSSVTPPMAQLVGAKPHEVVVMNTLTVNLHLMMSTFYQPNGQRREILIEQHAFPSDHQAVASHLRLRGQDPAESLVVLEPTKEDWLFETEAICDAIRQRRDTLALVLLPGLQYYSGQVLDMAAITRVAREYEIPIGFDLAHAAGNISLALHDWDMDFACWCTYKYLNSGPGALGGCFLHERHATNTELPRLAGWWGHRRDTRFQMRPEFSPSPNAEGWQLSNPPILALAGTRASLEVFQEAGGMGPLREKSIQLTGYLRRRLQSELGDQIRVVTPADPRWSGCQLSLEVHSSRPGREVYDALESAAIRTDWREPNVIRAAPTPLYNRFAEVDQFVATLASLLAAK